MKIKTIISELIVVLTLLFQSVYAKTVEQQTAEQVAVNFYLERYNALGKDILKTVSITSSFVISEQTKNMYYIFNINNSGYIIVSADDVVHPVLAYSFEGIYTGQNQPPQFKYWMNTYKEQILYAIESKLSSTAEIDAEWARLKVNRSQFSPVKDIMAVAPLFLSTWDQSECYNDLCPVDSDGPGGHVYAGCVATAMAQVMYYYRYPLQGLGTHSYSSSYGNLSVNYGTTTYDWNAMTTSCNGTNNAIATLLYHCGVSVNMSYSPTGSAAYTSNADNAMSSHFKYSSNINHNYKSSYSTSQWENKIRTELDNKRPVIYSGHDPGSGSGHAFNCDGYQGTNHFHFNFGWSGFYNAYFYMSNINPGTYNFTSSQEAVCNIYPGSGYPYNCSGAKNITIPVGTFEDGSGSSNYQNNIDCSWLIAPSCAGHINLFFDDFNTEANNDVVKIYDGSTTSAPVLATVSGNTFPASVSSTAPTMLLKFTTNGSNASTGWHVNFNTTYPAYCSGMTTLNAASDTFTDGSGTCDYNNSTICQWKIEPTGASKVTLHFTDFNTEPTNDKIRIIDPASSTVLATYSGTNIPAPVTSNSGKMQIIFMANSSINGHGWTAYYTSNVGLDDFNSIKKMSVYPNPANDKLTVSFTINSIEDISFEIIDIRGKVVYSENSHCQKPDFSKDFDVSNLSKGIYNIRILTSVDIINKKIVIY